MCSMLFLRLLLALLNYASSPENTAPCKIVSSPIIRVVWTLIVFEDHHLFPLIWEEPLNLAAGARAFSASVVLLVE